MFWQSSIPRNLYWKEMRQLSQVVVALLGCQLLCWVFLFFMATFFPTILGESTVRVPIELFLVGAVATAGLLGSLFFSMERDNGTAGFLFRLPVSRWQIFQNKILAALTSMALLVAGSAILFFATQTLWAPTERMLSALFSLPRQDVAGHYRLVMPFGLRHLHYFILIALTFYFAAAFVSLRIANTIGVFFSTALLLVLFGRFVAVSFSILVAACFNVLDDLFRVGISNLFFSGGMLLLRDRDFSWVVPTGYLTMLLACVAALWRSFSQMEERTARTDWAPGRRLARFSFLRQTPNTLWRVDARQKRMVFGLVLAVLTMGFVLKPMGTPVGGLLYPLVLLLVGIAAGVMMFSTQERDGVGFFLHFLPIPRAAILRQRLAMGLLTGCIPFAASVLIVCVAYVLSVYMQSDTRSLELLRHTPAILEAACALYVVGFLTGAMFSAVVRSDITGIFFAIVALAVPGVMSLKIWSYPTLYPAVAFVAFLYFVTRWIVVRSRAFEPGIRHDARALLLLGGFWLFGTAIDLINPFDVIYLLTGFELSWIVDFLALGLR